MATNIDKALYQQPQGIDDLAQDQPDDFEIEIVDPEEVNIHAGDLDISIKPGEDDGEDFNANLADEMDDSAKEAFAEELVEDIDNDKNSRKDWENAYTQG